MLSYQHKYHAGNHADVIKHVCLIAVLRRLVNKPKDFFVLDTHAGEGIYRIDVDEQSDEVFAKKLLNIDWSAALLTDYLQMVRLDLAVDRYPGSPTLIQTFLSSFKQQKISFHANELAKSSYEQLKTHLTGKVFFHQVDAFKLLHQLIPPKPRRGLVLIDPPYEDISEYQQVEKAVCDGLKKWPEGIFVIWYPLLSVKRFNAKTRTYQNNPKSGLSENLLNQLQQNLNQHMLKIEFKNTNKNNQLSMYGSGVCIINAPWQTDNLIECAVNELNEKIAQDGGFIASIDWLIAPK